MNRIFANSTGAQAVDTDVLVAAVCEGAAEAGIMPLGGIR